MLWTRERVAAQHARVVDEREFDRRRLARMQEREARARLYRFPGGNVIAFPTRPPVETPPDRAA